VTDELLTAPAMESLDSVIMSVFEELFLKGANGIHWVDRLIVSADRKAGDATNVLADFQDFYIFNEFMSRIKSYLGVVREPPAAY
jgi:hypothetical protein